MNKSSIVLLVAVIIVCMAVGVAATRVNYRILPSGPIVVSPQLETNGTSPRLKGLNIIALTLGSVESDPTRFVTHSAEKEYEQGDLMGISLTYSFAWDNLLRIEPNSSAVSDKADEYIYFGGNLSAHFVTTLQIFNSDGSLVADNEGAEMFGGGGSSSASDSGTSRRDYFIQVPFNWEPGTYTVRITVEDLLTGLEDSKETTTEILTGSPPQERHPSPVTTNPADIIIGLEDLHDEWNITSEDSIHSILEDFIASYHRGFSKAVGDYNVVFDVRVVQFENVEEANSSFYSRLEMMRKNEMYGHGKVFLESLADGCFLYDDTERRSLDWYGWNVDGHNASTWAFGSSVVFVRQNIVVYITTSYNYGALSQGIFLTSDQLMDFARIQAAKIS